MNVYICIWEHGIHQNKNSQIHFDSIVFTQLRKQPITNDYAILYRIYRPTHTHRERRFLGRWYTEFCKDHRGTFYLRVVNIQGYSMMQESNSIVHRQRYHTILFHEWLFMDLCLVHALSSLIVLCSLFCCVLIFYSVWIRLMNE